MHDTFSIQRNGQTYWGRRFLRLHHGRTYQTVFYLNISRCDPAGYSNFASDDPAMNAAAAGLLTDMIDQPPPGAGAGCYRSPRRSGTTP